MKNHNSPDSTTNQENNNPTQEQESSCQDSKQNCCVQELDQAKERLRYLMAEFDNYKRRTEKERIDWMESAKIEVLTDILDLSDDFDRALNYTSPENNNSEKSLKDGVLIMHKTLSKILKKYKVEEIEFDKNFDPEKQEAIMQINSPDNKSGEVVKILQKGFICKNTVLRPAKVAVAE